MRKPKITFTLICEPEIEPIRGHFASGDDELDRATEDAIIARASRGDVWAWCSVRVKATHENGAVGYSAWLGCCSYEDEADYIGDGESGYYADQCEEAREALLTFGVSHAQPIRVKFVGPSEKRGARFKVSAYAGVKYVPYDHALNRDANYCAAAKKYATELGWTGRFLGGELPDGKGYVFVCEHDNPNATIEAGE